MLLFEAFTELITNLPLLSAFSQFGLFIGQQQAEAEEEAEAEADLTRLSDLTSLGVEHTHFALVGARGA